MSFTLDMNAAARVARRVQLAEIRLVDLTLKRTADTEGAMALSGDVKKSCSATKWDGGLVEVSCGFHFGATDADSHVAFIDATYLLRYRVAGEDPVSEADAKHFAYANGAYNAWPFARELFHSFSSRMGLPPFVLPVLIFTPPKPATPTVPAPQVLAAPEQAALPPLAQGTKA